MKGTVEITWGEVICALGTEKLAVRREQFTVRRVQFTLGWVQFTVRKRGLARIWSLERATLLPRARCAAVPPFGRAPASCGVTSQSRARYAFRHTWGMYTIGYACESESDSPGFHSAAGVTCGRYITVTRALRFSSHIGYFTYKPDDVARATNRRVSRVREQTGLSRLPRALRGLHGRTRVVPAHGHHGLTAVHQGGWMIKYVLQELAGRLYLH
eukprot:704909-Prorocentrum_minimum.AAC.1